jgi:hypothetical protein
MKMNHLPNRVVVVVIPVVVVLVVIDIVTKIKTIQNKSFCQMKTTWISYWMSNIESRFSQ